MFFDDIRSRLLSFWRHPRRRPVWIALGVLVAVATWAVHGGSFIARINPSLAHLISASSRPALNVWMTPPDYAGGAPVMLFTPAGASSANGAVEVPLGSVVSARVAGGGGDALALVVDGEAVPFTADDHGDWAADKVLTNGKKLSIRRGWTTLASWTLRLVGGDPPNVSMADPPSVTESKNIRLSYQASDALRVDEVVLRVTPHNPLPGANNAPVEIPLPAAPAKDIARVDFQDLTARPWAGQRVTLQIAATNAVGKRSVTAPADIVVPERHFFHPVSRVLIEERKKLLLHPDDVALREEAADIMAGIAHDARNFGGDPVVMMALRSGAVRLILNSGREAVLSINDLLWQTAARIEDGDASQAQQMLRDARQDLADAMARKAGAEEIRLLTDRLQQAIAHYVGQLQVRLARQRVPFSFAPGGDAHARFLNPEKTGP